MARKRDRAWNYLINLQNKNGVLFERDIESILNRYMLSLKDRAWIYKKIDEEDIYVSVLPDNTTGKSENEFTQVNDDRYYNNRSNHNTPHHQLSKETLNSKKGKKTVFPWLDRTGKVLKNPIDYNYSYENNRKLVKAIPNKYAEIKILTESVYYSDESESIKSDLHLIIKLALEYSEKNKVDFEELLSECFYDYSTVTGKNGKRDLNTVKHSIKKHIDTISLEKQIALLFDYDACFYCAHLQCCLLNALKQLKEQSPIPEKLMVQYIDDHYSEIELDGLLNNRKTDFIPCFKSVNVNRYKSIADYSCCKNMERLLEKLRPREREVLRLRFGYIDNKEKTLEEIGHELGITRERVRQIEKTALRKIKLLTQKMLIEDLEE